jgi:hypothetical protein
VTSALSSGLWTLSGDWRETDRGAGSPFACNAKTKGGNDRTSLQVLVCACVRGSRGHPGMHARATHAAWDTSHAPGARAVAAAPHRLGQGPAPQHVAPTARRGSRPGHAPARAGPPACRVACDRSASCSLSDHRPPARPALKRARGHRVRLPALRSFCQFAQARRVHAGIAAQQQYDAKLAHTHNHTRIQACQLLN